MVSLAQATRRAAAAIMSGQLPTEIRPNRPLTAAEFHRLADVPPEVEWFANISNQHTRRAYENAVRDFMQFAGIRRPEEFRYSATVRMSGERQQGCPVAACVEDGVTGASRQGSRWDVTRTKR